MSNPTRAQPGTLRPCPPARSVEPWREVPFVLPARFPKVPIPRVLPDFVPLVLPRGSVPMPPLPPARHSDAQQPHPSGSTAAHDTQERQDALALEKLDSEGSLEDVLWDILRFMVMEQVIHNTHDCGYRSDILDVPGLPPFQYDAVEELEDLGLVERCEICRDTLRGVAICDTGGVVPTRLGLLWVLRDAELRAQGIRELVVNGRRPPRNRTSASLISQ
jgi:hypothetical protein